jgi:hypothetical protein
MTYALRNLGVGIFSVSCIPIPLECVVLALDTLTYAIFFGGGVASLIVIFSYFATGT